MSKEKLFHRAAKDSKGLVGKLQSFRDRGRPLPYDAVDAQATMYDRPPETFLNPSYRAPGAEATEIVSFPQAISTPPKQG